MKEQIWEYVVGLFKDIPSGVYIGLAAVLIGVVLMMVVYGGWKGARMATGLLLAEYVFLLFSSTVIFRATSERFSGYDYHPFWSYRAIQSGESQLMVENIMNVAVFVPVGIILGSLLRVKGSWFIALLFGLGISVSIETLQFFLKRGFAEVDDVMHNTAGCILGALMVKGAWLMVKGCQKLR